MKHTITRAQVDALIMKSTFVDTQLGAKTTIVTMTLENGFELTATSSCMDPDDYVHDIGIARCVDKLQVILHEMESYRLQCELRELKEKEERVERRNA